MRIALLLPFSPSDPANSGVARLEMFSFFPDCQLDYYHFGPSDGTSISIGAYHPGASLENFKSFPSFYAAFKMAHRSQPYDAIWTTLPPIMMALFARVAARRLRIPLIVDVRDPGIASTVMVAPPTTRTYKIAHRLEKWLYKGATAVCVTTPELGRLLTREFGVSPKRITVISNATIEKESSHGSVNPKSINVFYAGTFAPYQPIGKAIDNLLTDSARSQFQFNFYGYDEKQNPELAQRVAKSNSESIIHLHPRLPRTELFDKLRASDIVLVPIELKEYSELYDYAVPLKFYEALAFSKPVVLFGGTAASKRIVDETQAGVVCPVESPLFTALEKVADHYTGYQKAADMAVFSRKAEAKKLLGLVKNITQ